MTAKKTKKIERTISVDHVARIEGKTGIEVTVTKGEVVDVRLNVFEGPRYFEAITLGKPVEEAVAVFPRVCSFCAAAHKITAVEAAERALDITPSEQTHKLRELLYIGDYIESHALHLFLLVLPDFFGFPDAFSMGKAHPDVLKAGVALKDIGADIQTVIGSRYIHQENALIGGFGKIPSKTSLEDLADRLRALRTDAEEAVENLISQRDWRELNAPRLHLALRPLGDVYTMFGDYIDSSDGSKFKTDAYKVRINERVASYSFAKHGFFNQTPFMTGALSRYTLNGDRIGGRAGELAKTYAHHLNPENPMSNNFAQGIEIIHYVHRAEEIARDLATHLKENERRIKPDYTHAGTGVSVTEAPRGLLAYTLQVDKNGLVTHVDIITPTAMFIPMVEADLRRMAAHLVNEGETDNEAIGQKLETVVRSYDPCVSCSVHVSDVH